MLLGIFVLTTLAVALLMTIRDTPRAEAAERLRQAVQAGSTGGGSGSGEAATDGRSAAADDGEGDRAGRGPWRGLREALRRSLGRVDARVEHRLLGRWLQLQLRRAGLRILPAEFLAFQCCAAFCAELLATLLGYSRLWWLILPAGTLAPLWWLRRRGHVRARNLEQQLPDALALIANSLRSGFSFLQALAVVAREMPDPIAREAAQVLKENRVGIPLDAALTSMAERVGSQDLDLVVTAVLIQRQVGGNLAEIADTIADTIKGRLHLLGQVRTLTAQGRFSGLIVSLLPVLVGLALFSLNPAYISPLFDTTLGWLLLGVGGVMQGVGILVIRHLVHLEV